LTVRTISRAELAAALGRRQIILIDVLSPESYAKAHLPDSINLPVADIGARAAAVLPDRRASIVTYCGGPT